MSGLYAGFNVSEIYCLIPEVGSLTPEALQERLADIRSKYAPEQLAAFLQDDVPLFEMTLTTPPKTTTGTRGKRKAA
jgi:hypothetical protein